MGVGIGIGNVAVSLWLGLEGVMGEEISRSEDQDISGKSIRGSEYQEEGQKI